MSKTIANAFLVIISAAMLNWRYASSQLPLVGTIEVVNAGMLSVYKHDIGDPLTTYSIIASTYDTTRASNDNVFGLVYPGQTIGSNFTGMRKNIISNVLYFPKEVQQMPGSLLQMNELEVLFRNRFAAI